MTSSPSDSLRSSTPREADLVEGRSIVRMSWIATALFALTAVVAAIWLRSPWQPIAFTMAIGLSAVGCVLFGWAFLRLASRSRTHEFGIGGMFFAAGSAPPAVTRTLNASLAAQVAVAIGTAAARPFTSLAFGCLVPLVGIACTGLWCARHGTFPERRDMRAPVAGRAVRGGDSGRSMGKNDRHG
jgi:hypothetical protein